MHYAYSFHSDEFSEALFFRENLMQLFADSISFLVSVICISLRSVKLSYK